MKHTKGPWKAIKDLEYNRICIDSYNGNDECEPIAELKLGDNANAQLIASAPELLRALEVLVSTIDCACAGPVKSGKCSVCKAHAVIAKAKGEL